MKLPKIFLALSFFFAFMIISACKKNKVEPVDPVLTQEELFYTQCGKMPPVIACLNGGKVFIPNAVSANSDGFNDIFSVFVGNGIKTIENLKIFNEEGSLIFQKANIFLNNAVISDNGWDGSLPDGSIVDGIYNYTVKITNLLEETIEIEGAVCVRTSFPINCVENEKHMAWGTQHNGNGDVDFSLPSYEECE